MACNENKYTLTHSEFVKGWTSFHSFHPDFMIGMNNKHYSFKDGNIYLHHSDNVPRNTFYGVQYPTKVSVIANKNPSEIKTTQAIMLEGNLAWDALIKAYVSNSDDTISSTIDKVEFVKKEGLWYAYTRRNEDTEHFNSKSTYGIGEIININGSELEVSGIGNTSLTTNDTIVRGSDLTLKGTINTITKNQASTTVELTSVGDLVVGDFILGMKDARTEGANMRGYVTKIELEITDDNKVELFAVNSEIVKSYS